MDDTLAPRSADVVRDVIARDVLGAVNGSSELGTVVLRPHQLDAVQRIRVLLEQSGGALLADEVGLGKTFVALALARQATRPLVVAPASLLAMWKESAQRAAVSHATFVSHETLSRRRHSSRHDLVVVDEAHHARNPATRRYRELARLCTDARVLLLSATPVHNKEGDLRALFALFRGSRAWSCELSDLLTLIVRRNQSSLGPRDIPVASAPAWLSIPFSDDLLNEIANLPPPLPPRDGGEAGALITHGLIRQWTSSDAALLHALTRRRARALSLIAALENGRYPSRSELSAWCHAEDSLQLAFPELVSSTHPHTAELLDCVRAHDRSLKVLLEHVSRAASSDIARASHLLELRGVHAGGRVVAFTQFADTARGLYRLVAPYGGCAVLTAAGAMTPGGRMSRNEVLARFNAPETPPAERVDLLLATDLLSEGIDLPEVSVIIHLDFPWTAARLQQRVGRALRLGSRYREVRVYCMSPPASAESLLRVQDLLHRKLDDAARSIGRTPPVLPPLATETSVIATPASPAEAYESFRRALRRWLSPNAPPLAPKTIFAAVRGNASGWLALIVDDSAPVLIACVGVRVTDSLSEIGRMLELFEGADHCPQTSDTDTAIASIQRFMRFRRGATRVSLAAAPGNRSGHRLLQRINSITARAPLHRRRHIVELASRARSAVLAQRGIASEASLVGLAESPLSDESWLEAVGSFAPQSTEPQARDSRSYQVRALLLLCSH